MQVIPGQTGIELAREVAHQMQWPLLIPEYKTFSDGEQFIRLTETPKENVLVIQSLYNPQEFYLFQLLNLIATVKRLGSSKITVYIPYMCYARADRDVTGGEAISALTVIQLIEAVGVNHLITLDIHNPDIFSNVTKMETTNIFPHKSMARFLIENVKNPNELQIIAPDAGAVARAESVAKDLGVPSANLDKNRDPSTGNVNITIGRAKIERKRIVLIDDIMSTGSSLIQSALLLTLFNVEEIHILVTHVMNTDAVDRLIEIGGGIIASTNSVPSIISKISSTEDIVSVLNNEVVTSSI